MQHRLYLLIIPIVLLLVSCGGSDERRYFDDDCPKAEVRIIRFDSSIIGVHQDNILTDIRRLYATYPAFMPGWVEDILGIPSRDTATLVAQLPLFLNDTVYGFKHTNAYEQEVFRRVDDLENRLAVAFGRLHSLYPEWRIPTIYLMISGFQTSVYFVNDTTIAVGADMYLGSDYEYYNKLVYNYQKQTMRKECVVADVVSACLFHTIDYTAARDRLLDQMIYRGKVMYLLSVLDEEPEYEIMGWTKDSWEWCRNNERGIWAHMMDTRAIYNNAPTVVSSYLNDGPFTSEISQECPARIGTWIGLQIVRRYMENNRDVTLRMLMEESDSQKILEQSKYRP